MKKQKKIKQLTIPVFDKGYESWSIFYDMFTKTIHENKKLKYVQNCTI